MKNELETILTFAIVARGTAEDFESVKRYLTEHTTASIVYQTIDYGKLFIKRGEE
jgi:hypothetical protein